MALSARQIVRIVLTVVCVVIVALPDLPAAQADQLDADRGRSSRVALSPPVNVLARRMRRGFAITIVYLGLLAIPIALIALIVPPLITEANKFADNVPAVRARRDQVREGERAAARAQRGLRHHRASSRTRRASCPTGSAARPGRCATSASASSTRCSR